MADTAGIDRLRREPPRFRRVEVRRVEGRSPRLLRVTFGGDALEGFTVEQPAASVRLLLPGPDAPEPDASELVVPEWNGNEFLLPDGRRPIIRTFTPRRSDASVRELDLDIVVHGGGAASEWAARVGDGAVGAISGPGRGYDIDANAPAFLLAGDETAIPAMSQLLEHLPAEVAVRVFVEIAHRDARSLDDDLLQGAATWIERAADAPPGDGLFAAIRTTDLAAREKIWVAGEAAAMQRIRRHLFDERGVTRQDATVRGYWKHGRVGG